MKYFGNRQNPLKDVGDERLDSAFKELIDRFGEKWLSKEGDHPLQILWKRRDFLATNQLFTLGDSLLTLKGKNESWIKKHIDKIKTGTANNRIGSVFEIISAASIEGGCNQEVELPVTDNPGYDLTVTYNDGGINHISCKNYGMSSHNQDFIRNSKEIEKYFLAICQELRLNKIQCYIVTLDKFPAREDWDSLKSNLKTIAKSYTGQKVSCVVGNIWFVGLSPIPEEEEFAATKISYTFIIISPFHKNEEQNLYSKLDDACYNLISHGVKQSENVINLILVHLPITANISACQEWGSLYLKNHPDKEIAGIIFIQPSVCTDVDAHSTSIVYSVSMVTNDFYTKWNGQRPSRTLNFVVPVGATSGESSKMLLFVGDQTSEISKCYLYQSGHHYVVAKTDSDGTITGNLSKVSSGLFKHSVFRINGSELLMQGRFPPTDDLILI